MQFGGVNYLMPTDASLTDEADLRRMVRVDEIVADLKQAQSVRILILDSCRDNPIAEEFKRSIGRSRAVTVERGLARIDVARGMIISYATQPGQTADDGAPGGLTLAGCSTAVQCRRRETGVRLAGLSSWPMDVL
jgi:uncharacterized caspase-like protein